MSSIRDRSQNENGNEAGKICKQCVGIDPKMKTETRLGRFASNALASIRDRSQNENGNEAGNIFCKQCVGINLVCPKILSLGPTPGVLKKKKIDNT